jgi:hypothetical protein
LGVSTGGDGGDGGVGGGAPHFVSVQLLQEPFFGSFEAHLPLM